MRPSLALLVALLLVGTLPAGGTAAAAPAHAATDGAAPETPTVPTAPANATALNGTTVLLVPDTSREGFAGGGTSLGAALDVQRDALDGRLARYVLESRFDRQSSSAGKRAALGATLERIDRRVGALAAAEDRARVAYLNRSIDAEAYVTRLARVQARASALDRLVRRVGELDGATTETAFTNRTRYLRMRLAFLTGPVRARAAAALDGGGPPVRVYVASSGSGTMLSAVFNETYVSETSRLDHFDGAEQGESVDLDAAFNRSAELYPYAWNRSPGQRVDSLGTNAYHVTIPYGDGRVEAYVDGSTGQVFREVQVKDLDAVTLGPAASERRADLLLRVHRTHAGGPLRVHLADSDGDPVTGTIRVEGMPVGSTANGTLWTVGFGSEFVVSAERGSTQIPLIVRPVDQPVDADNRTAA